MSVTIRPAELLDLKPMVDLLVLDAKQRAAENPTLWKLAPDAQDKITSSIQTAMENENPPFRQQWLLAESGGEIVGLTHSILLPVPPIYAGEFGAPGLIMEDCFVVDAAPDGTAQSLLEAAEADLVKAGAKVLLASSIAEGAWATEYSAQNYEPLTLYFAKIGLTASAGFKGVRQATESDVPAIVASSADNRQILNDLHSFWKPHPEADTRFGNWMSRSLTLPDRDMFVSETEGVFRGYAVSQPATALHFPIAHDVSGIGFMDDYFHTDFESHDALRENGTAASALFRTAESALKSRGNNAALIVCPAAWSSKISLLQNEGYEPAIVWYIKR
ncbi:hypothetical protein BCF46_0344 [Litoreibacter meonggei]|uniref:N-acetyltransferase domain-containing protein n=1 Tax=Litoreibacter meonggei TaxID=1049199 RepID=A0A497X4K1_9RHOB|nr:hypothetical protein [Litoreibacter meonggei]RLJ60147.1 hypothetical protein BCF46_0344 [Litoreibacter meonggei]